jgi:hypothetical protein
MKKNKYIYISALILSAAVLFLPCAEAGIGGKDYYTFAPDYTNSTFQNFTWRFGDNETEGDSDNESTDNTTTTQGSVRISAQATELDNETGAYMTLGILFNGTWEAATKEYSAFYEADIYTYYSFLFYGVAFYRGAYVAGLIYSDTIIESTAKDTEEIISIMPFFGIGVPAPQ